MEFPKYPLTLVETKKIAETYPTPFHIYFEDGIVKNAKRLKEAFSWNSGFKEFFAVKACPNPHILSLLKKQGFGTDCSSLPELVMSERVGIKGEEIMFSSNDTPKEEFEKASELGAIINLDDISHIEFLETTLGGKMPELISFRYNPGPMRQTGEENVIGNPEDAKYGFTKEQLFEGYKMCKEKGVKRFGIHTMIVSNELTIDNLVLTAEMLFELAIEIKEKLGIELEFVNVGGGVGVAYKPDQTPVNLEELSSKIKEKYDSIIVTNKMELNLYMENGRFITGPYGFLISKVRHMKHTYKDYVGLDGSMANLMRPALYGAYHHETVIGKEELPLDHKYDVTGSLCENNDKFAVDRMLPEIVIGDYLAIHDAGAHGYAMGFNYNGKLRSSELLYTSDGTVKQIRRAENIEDYFSTLDFGTVE
ncbi:MAG: diaminopimelate decarboxylase [Candidatus Diapherotrites archaeon]|uniref:Diaminopimelate decarboxylase n=1 Tax=Candidatus Iainarchaeum sp. TaxID=3101447 RepID=A0A8T5GEI3_9ARCH|nr:diaminopimelate decarboxylase [Candidatus Diapherotrites archaeon]MBT7241490.1 diaminopimelate decarboxylase [Candidatus Diapherotrites archaeon]